MIGRIESKFLLRLIEESESFDAGVFRELPITLGGAADILNEPEPRKDDPDLEEIECGRELLRRVSHANALALVLQQISAQLQNELRLVALNGKRVLRRYHTHKEVERLLASTSDYE